MLRKTVSVALLVVLYLPFLSLPAKAQSPRRKSPTPRTGTAQTPKSVLKSTLEITITREGNGAIRGIFIIPIINNLGVVPRPDERRITQDIPKQWKPRAFVRKAGSTWEIIAVTDFDDLVMLNEQLSDSASMTGGGANGNIVWFEDRNQFEVHVRYTPPQIPYMEDRFTLKIDVPAVISFTGQRFASQTRNSITWTFPVTEANEVAVRSQLGEPYRSEIPPAPPGVDIRDNINEAHCAAARFEKRFGSGIASLPAKVFWFWGKYKWGKEWDYKLADYDKYQDFGNFNYGAAGLAAGIPEDVLLGIAGEIQASDLPHPEWGSSPSLADILRGNIRGTGPCYGDDCINDHKWVKKGMEWYKENYKNRECGSLK